MSFVGKFFVVMQILLSVTFMGFAVTVFTYQTDWKATAEDSQKSLSVIEENLKNLQAEYDAFTTEKETALKTIQGEADTAKAANAAYKREINDLQSESQRFANDLQTQTSLASIAEDEAEDRRSEAMTQRVVNVGLHKKLKDKSDESLKVADEHYSLEVLRDSLIAKNKELVKELAFLRKVVRNNNLETDPRIYAAQTDPPPKMDGIVLNVGKNKKGSVDHVEISGGSDDGLIKGHILSLYRSGLQTGEKAQYLGQIKLTYVDSDRSVGTIIEKAKSGIIKRGDNVTTKF
ncbi:MAG: hypothetical protein JKY95_01290 [Planctomycetaceae bacterium]|nr:hypothetical protein [Planctomycetaceae bacterium]